MKSGAAIYASSVMTVYMAEADEGRQQITVLFFSDKSREPKSSSRSRRVSMSKHIRGLGTNKNNGHESRRDTKPIMTVLARSNSKLLPYSALC
jgi:hypothetical protein